VRRIQKGPPPTNISPAGRPARTFQQAHLDLQADLGTIAAAQQAARARASFDDLKKDALRDLLYVEQRHVCVYCERRVQETNTPPIEHWDPVRAVPHQAITWENLYLSCPSQATCDDAKQHQQLSLPWPTQRNYELAVGFTSGGEIYVRTNAPISANEHQALVHALRRIVNLNHPRLVAARKAAIDAEKKRLEREYPGRHLSGTERTTIATNLLAEARRPEFASIRVAYLQRTLGHGRP
jgi:uncharacterized protein (TIGR02646 family)